MIQIVSKHTQVAWVINSYSLCEHVILHCQVTLDIEDLYRISIAVTIRSLEPGYGVWCAWQGLET